jgi:SAM-dependent methyltransferase
VPQLQAGSAGGIERAASADTASRTRSFGEGYRLTAVDRFGIWLSRRQIGRCVASLTGKVVGDFGCGFHARLARSVLGEVERAYLVDVSLASDLAAHPRVVAIQGALPGALAAVPDGSLDIALCISVLEHLSDPDRMLRELMRVLKPGGTALVNVPSWRGKTFLELSAFRLGLSPAAEMDDHKMYYDVRDLWPRLVLAGFRPSRVRCFSHKFGLNTFAVCQKDPA